jgi:hypothetical protein
MKCGLCSHEFTESDVQCNPACPMVGGCPVVCCPSCGYGAPDESRSTLVGLVRKARRVALERSRRRKEAS